MTIRVDSNDALLAAASKTLASSEASENTQSAPVAQDASEQNETEASEPSETGEKEATDQSEGQSDEDQASKDAAKDKTKSKSGFQRRIDKLNARHADAQRELEYWKREALQKGATAPKPETKVDQKPAAGDEKPNPNDFDSHEEYVDALTDWKLTQKLKERDQSAEKARAQTEQEKAEKAHLDRVKAFKEKNADFDDVVSELEGKPISAAVEAILVSSEQGPELLYELAKHPEEFERINSLGWLAAAREIGKLESKLATSTPAPKEPKKITQAPKPIEPVGKGSSGPVSKDPSDPDLSQADYERIRREQMRRKRA